MKHPLAALKMFVLALLLVVTDGCASGKSNGGNSTSAGGTTAASQRLSNAAPSPGAASAGGPTIPNGAQWTLYCLTIPGRDHVAQANQLKADLLRTSSMKDWYVVHQENESILCYGYY